MSPSFRNYTTVRKDRRHDQRGGLLTFVHKEINYFRTTESPEILADPHLEELTSKSKLDNTELIIFNIYIPPTRSCLTSGYLPSLDHLMTTTDTLVLGDFNAHNSSWYSRTNDSRGNHLENAVSNANLGILNWDSPTRLPCNASPFSPNVSLASASLITSANWQTKTTCDGSDHLPILIRIQMESSTKPIPHRTSHKGEKL